ncbi:hypothetical protein ABEX47_03060 [Paenibacillus ehimensis]|uniref:hypothetical protein n=1 Tax=Paenibacillus ehimensis TaxID=79264 RepID=UPI003D28AB57
MERLGRFDFVVREYQSIDFYNNNTFYKEAVGIGLFDSTSGMVFPSPLSQFIKSVYQRKNVSLSTQRNPAYEIVKFLNFINEQIRNNNSDFGKLKVEGLFGLRLEHGSYYISYLASKAINGDMDGNYVYRIEKYLIEFYKWLNKQEILYEPIQFEEDGSSPFDDIELGTIYPNKQALPSNRLVDFGENRLELVIKFLRIADYVAPEIALGIAFQFFGGLRAGEVVNLTKKSLEYPKYNSDENGADKFILKVRDNQKYLFNHRATKIHEQVKRPRTQTLLIHPLLTSMYVKHKLRLNRLLKDNKIKNSQALFISESTGNAISGKSYHEKFMAVKEAFLLQLSKEERIEDYEYLTQKRWSTHIGRGVFTNFLLDIGATVTQVAIARGDKSITAVLKYVEETNAIKITQDALNKIRIAYDRELSEITVQNIESWSLTSNGYK